MLEHWTDSFTKAHAEAIIDGGGESIRHFVVVLVGAVWAAAVMSPLAAAVMALLVGYWLLALCLSALQDVVARFGELLPYLNLPFTLQRFSLIPRTALPAFSAIRSHILPPPAAPSSLS